MCKLTSLQLRDGMTIRRSTGATYSSIKRTSAHGRGFLGILDKWEGEPSMPMSLVLGKALTFRLRPGERVEVC